MRTRFELLCAGLAAGLEVEVGRQKYAIRNNQFVLCLRSRRNAHHGEWLHMTTSVSGLIAIARDMSDCEVDLLARAVSSTVYRPMPVSVTGLKGIER